PEQIARRVPGRLLVVKHRRSPIQSWVLDTVDFFRDSGPVARRLGSES
ncbi:MAG: hypothetical protein GWN99_04280, partial [Gemmatimonadetes bacterium]|nr:hypothetical protein [Gemmatimonadota bacterium]NIS00282.1 hypothetical protein [Gemmatimonadota bacterium]NIT65936.1 hypothetical protein [Gemmatimonadota bacterium]NIV25456.1 hypothetical protein [Gemmatimonadota bacterium]NIW77106.1 hypothetical protein [Gemmatimonadota bacterium]